MSGLNAVLARNTAKAPAPVGPYSQTDAFSHYNNLSAQLPVDPATGKIVPGGIKEQAAQCFANIKAVLDSIGHTMDDVVRVSVFLANINDVAAVDEVYLTYFPSYRPTRTTVGVAALPLGALVQIEALSSNAEGTIPNEPQSAPLVKLVRNTDAAPQRPLNSQTVAFSHYNNLSAQLPIDPQSGRIVDGGIKEQTAQCLKNIKAVLTSIDVPFDDIVKCTIFLTDLADLDAVNEVYMTFFPDSAIARAVHYMPARTVVQAAALRMGAKVQIEAVVSHGDGTPPQPVEDRHNIVIKAHNTKAAPKDPFSTQTVAFSHYNHISAQLPIDPKTGEMVAGGAKEQAAQCLANIKAIIESVGHVTGDIVKVNLYLTNIDDLAAVDEAYKVFFPEGIPARKTVGVGALPKGALVMIDAVAGNAEGTKPPKEED